MMDERFGGRREEINLCYAGRDIDLTPGIRFGPVIRDIYVIECCTGGYGSVIINGTEHFFGPGSCYILMPGDVVTHTADAVEPRRGVWCGVDGLMLGRHLSRAGITSESPFAPPELFGELCGWVEQLATLWEGERDGGTSLAMTACVYSFLAALLRNSASLSPSAAWVERALGLMESRYYEPLSVDVIAREIGLERAYFSTLFRQHTGLPPHRYLTALRIRKACGMLSAGERSISDIAAAVGLDPRNFARLFKRETGITPYEYRSRASK